MGLEFDKGSLVFLPLDSSRTHRFSLLAHFGYALPVSLFRLVARISLAVALLLRDLLLHTKGSG